MEKRIALLPGDGIGVEIMDEARKVLDKVASKFGHSFVYKEALIGGGAYDEFGTHLPQETLKICEATDAILFGAVGGPLSMQDDPKWSHVEANVLGKLRKFFGFDTHITPVVLYDSLQGHSLLKSSSVSDFSSMVLVRELTDATERACRFAFEMARSRGSQLTCIDQSPLLESSLAWRALVQRISHEFGDVSYSFLLVDNAAYQILKSPLSFDTLFMSGVYGDLFSYLLASIPGSIGLVPTASFNSDRFGIYEPVGGSAPDLAGKNIADPLAMILSAALMLRYSFDMNEEASCIEQAVGMSLQDGHRTTDIYEDGCHRVTTSEMGSIVAQNVGL